MAVSESGSDLNGLITSLTVGSAYGDLRECQWPEWFNNKFDSRASPRAVSESGSGLNGLITSLTVELRLWQSQRESEV